MSRCKMYRYRKYGLLLAVAFGLLAAAATPSRAIEDHYPYSIMTPEGGHHRATAPSWSRHVKTSPGRVRLLARRHGRMRSVARGSSGSVLPTPLPRTQLIPPERGGIPTPHRGFASNPGPTILPGGKVIPNLPHGTPETFQDRASRCAHQQGLFGVPGSAASTYTSACAM
jgi:hypothetical protein